MAEKEPDHSGVQAAREDEAQKLDHFRNSARERRDRIKSGHLSGEWVVIGGSIVNTSALFEVRLPTEGDENPTVTLVSFGGATITATGEQAKQFMEEAGLDFLPPTPVHPTANQSAPLEDGRIVKSGDREGAKARKAQKDQANSTTTLNRAEQSGPASGVITANQARANEGQKPIAPSGENGPQNPQANASQSVSAGADAPSNGGPAELSPEEEAALSPAQKAARTRAKNAADAVKVNAESKG